jgi:hypothetical protein
LREDAQQVECETAESAPWLDAPVAGRDATPDDVIPAVPSPDVSPAASEAAVRRIEHLPREIGVMLVSVGVLGFVLPGVMGTPAIIAGGLVLWPGAFGKLEKWLRRRNPDVYLRGMQQIGRFLDDLEKRYPPSGCAVSEAEPAPGRPCQRTVL